MNLNRSVFNGNYFTLVTSRYGYNQSVEELRKEILAFSKLSFSVKVLLLLLSLCLFWAFSNLFLKLNNQTGYVHGLQIDYLIPKLYVLDLLILGWLSAYTWQQRDHWIQFFQILSNKKEQLFIFFILTLAWFLIQLWTPFPIIGWLTLGRLAIYTTFFFLAYHFLSTQVSAKKILTGVFLLGVFIQGLLGFQQFFSQRSFTPYWVFGESYLAGQPNLARAPFSWLDDSLGTHFGLRMLPYGSLPHPNVLGGFLALGMLVLITFKLKHTWQRILKITGLFCLGIALFLTQSISAWLFLGLALIKPKLNSRLTRVQLILVFLLGMITVPIVISLSTPYSSASSLLRRHWLNQAGWQLWQNSPVFGVGAGQVTAQIETATQSQEVVAFVQPPHHVGILFLAENGVLGVAVVFLFLLILNTKLAALHVLFPLLPLLTLDHYLLSFPQGWWLIFLYWYFTNSNFQFSESKQLG